MSDKSPQDIESMMAMPIEQDKPLPSPRRTRHLFSTKTLFGITSILAAVCACYSLQSWKLDRESAEEMRALDLEIAPRFLGKKRLDRFGRIRRAPTNVVCGQGVPGASPAVDWSNYAVCSSNAVQHANCIKVCDSSFAHCDGCGALQQNRDDQYQTALSHCTAKYNYVCPLTTKSNGQYDYAALSNCCLTLGGTYHVGPASCLCEYQQSSSAQCFYNGGCLSQSSCLSAPSVTCSGTYTVQPPPVCPGVGVATCTADGTALTCGNFGGHQYYFEKASSTCVLTCEVGEHGIQSNGNFVCAMCPGVQAATCDSNGKTLTCRSSGVVINILDSLSGKCIGTCGTYQGQQMYYEDGNCIPASQCPSGVGSTVLGISTCTPCSDPGALTCAGAGLGKATSCGTVLGLQTYLYTSSSSSTCLSATLCASAHVGFSAVFRAGVYLCVKL